ESDDVSNELFKLANDQLNADEGWALPGPLAELLGPERRDMLIRAFARKKEARRQSVSAAPGSEEMDAAQRECALLSDGIEELIEATGCQRRYFEAWLARRAEAAELMGYAEIPDGAALLAGNDLLLVLHLMYKGKI